MLYCMRSQMFADGNKRVSMLAGNQIMIANGKGIISVPIEKQDEFRSKLIDFYETNDYGPMAVFIFDCCIDGIITVNDEDKNPDTALPQAEFFINKSKSKGETT